MQSPLTLHGKSFRLAHLLRTLAWGIAAAGAAIGSVYATLRLKITFAQANLYFLENPLKVLAITGPPVLIMVGYLQTTRRKKRKSNGDADLH